MTDIAKYYAAQPEINEMFLACTKILQKSSEDASVHIVISRLLAVALSRFPQEMWPVYLDKILGAAKSGAHCINSGDAP